VDSRDSPEEAFLNNHSSLVVDIHNSSSSDIRNSNSSLDILNNNNSLVEVVFHNSNLSNSLAEVDIRSSNSLEALGIHNSSSVDSKDGPPLLDTVASRGMDSSSSSHVQVEEQIHLVDSFK
jgi:hypothetical protein